MEKVTLRMLVLAAATIAPQIVTPDAEPATQARQAEQLSAEELSAVKRPEVYSLNDVAQQELAS
jgi:hypothetical protein